MGFRTQDNCVSTLAGQTFCLEVWDPPGAVRSFLSHDSDGLIGDLVRRYASRVGANTRKVGVRKISQSLFRAITVCEARRHGGNRASQELVSYPLSLIGAEKEELVLNDRAADVATVDIAVHLRTRYMVRVKEPLIRIPACLLMVGVNSAVKLVGSRLGRSVDLRPAVRPLRSVV